MTKAYVGLGANLGDRIRQINEARRRIAALSGVTAVRCSPLYETAPVGYQAQGDFINAVLELDTEIGAESLFHGLQSVEVALGRKRELGNRNAPRVIDIDLLLFGAEIIAKPELQIPHPRMHQRLFVLLPLADLNPLLPVAELGTVEELLQAGKEAKEFSGQRVALLGT